MSVAGKQALLDAVHGGMGFVGVHAASDTFHTEPDTKDLANRYIAHGENSDPYLRMLGGEFITHGSTPRLQNRQSHCHGREISWTGRREIAGHT